MAEKLAVERLCGGLRGGGGGGGVGSDGLLGHTATFRLGCDNMIQ